MASKDVENQLRPVNHAALSGFFDVSLLDGREVAVKNNEWRLVRGRFRANLVQLAAPHERGGIGSFAQLENRSGNFCTGAAR